MTVNDWHLHRDQIIRLYLHQNKTMRRTMDAVKNEHGLTATCVHPIRWSRTHMLIWPRPKMFKNKVTEWGIDKKNKKDEVLAMLCKNNQREAAGKKTVFELRGRPVNFSDVQRYAKRNRITDATIQQLVASRPQTPSDLVCSTPPLSPIPVTLTRTLHTGQFAARALSTCVLESYMSKSYTSNKGDSPANISSALARTLGGYSIFNAKNGNCYLHP